MNTHKTPDSDVLAACHVAATVQPYAVRAACGCITVRLFRNALARRLAHHQGIEYAEDMILDASQGAPCPDCECQDVR